MRLHHLELRAFGSFGGGESVDFDRLSDAGIFLLHGATGAGKTTILDAVSFALFGKVPGVRAAGETLRSDHATGSTPTEVRLEVTIRSHRYLIVRQPRQQLPKRRGSGMREHAPKATVRELVDREWVARAAKPTDADQLLREQLQMGAEQFHQIVMLPQGDFARFLRASPEDRRAVLEQLFATERFADVERWLKDRAEQSARAVGDATERVRRALAVAATIAVSEPYPEDAPITAAVEWLGARGDDAREAARSAVAVEGAARIAHDTAKHAHAEALELHGRQRRHADAYRDRAVLVDREMEHHLRRDALARARRAMPVLPLLDIVDQAAASARAGERQLAAARVALASLVPSLAEASLAELGDRVETLAGDLHLLDGLAPEAEQLTAREGELAALDQATAAVEAAHRERLARRERLPPERERIDRALREARDARHGVDAGQEVVARLEVSRRAAVERDTLSADLGSGLDTRRGATDAAQAAYAAWLALLETQLETRAAALAAKLEAGEACPVCGSAEHPRPAVAGHELVTDDEVDAARAAHEAATKVEQAAAAAVAAVETRLAAARATAGVADAAQLTAELSIASRALSEIHGRAARVARLERELAELAESARTLDEEVEELAAALARSREHRSGLDAVVGELRRRLAAARGGFDTLAERRGAVAAERTAVATLLDARSALDARRREERTARDRAVATARARGFADLDVARSVAVDDAALVDLEAAVKAHEKELAEVEGDLARPELAAAAACAPVDLEAASRAAAIAEHAWSAASTRATNATRIAAELETHRVETVSALEGLVPLVAESERARRLADLALGEDRQVTHRMRLSTYVLAARLEQVAAVASERLRRMSNDRYTIVHTDEEGDGRRKGGLGLRVVDAWTSTERDTNSLSGGESFFTSLALALGVADVVAAEAGGLQMETMFIDEGFGTLDDETLHDVLDVLDGLRAGGRAVGIVSHVNDLRSRVAAQVEVVKGSSGSQIRIAGA